MTALLALLAAAAAPQDLPSGFRAGDGGVVHQASGVTCPDLLEAGETAYQRKRVSQAGWRASCVYVSTGEAKAGAAFSIEVAPVPSATADGAESDQLLDVTGILMTRNAPPETVTHVATGIFTVRRAPETGKVERHVATRRGGWMINYSGVSTPTRETNLALAMETLARRPQLDTSSSFAALPE